MTDGKSVSSMSIQCRNCPASIQNVSVDEALVWNRTHDEMCPGAPAPMILEGPHPQCPDDGTTLRWTPWGYRCPECLVFVATPRRTGA